jgi:hypothetical protein
VKFDNKPNVTKSSQGNHKFIENLYCTLTMEGSVLVKVPKKANYVYYEAGIRFRVYYEENRVRIAANRGNITVIEYADTPHEGAKKAKDILINKYK